MQPNQTQQVTVKPSTIALARRIDEIAAGAMELFQSSGSFAEELTLAQAVGEMRACLTAEVMAPVMAMMNTDLGFRTDRDPNIPGKDGQPQRPYSVEVVRECFIEAKLRGFHAVGNEFNIISGRFYGAKNGFRRKVTRWPDLSNFKDTYEVPRIVGDKGAIVKCKATWKLNGEDDAIECEIPVKVNAYMGADAVLGKAERKLLKRVHDRISGMNTPEGDAAEVMDIQATPQPSVNPVHVIKPEPKEEQGLFNDPAPGRQPETPLPTVQQTLADVVIESGHSFDTFKAWGVECGQLQTPDDVNSFDDVPTPEARRIMRLRKLMIEGMNKAAGKGGGQ